MGILEYFTGTKEQQDKQASKKEEYENELDAMLNAGRQGNKKAVDEAYNRITKNDYAKYDDGNVAHTEFQRDLGTIAAAPPRLITSLPELGSIAVQAGQAANILPGADTSVANEPFLTRLAANRYKNGGFEQVKSKISEFQQKYLEANPNATKEEINKAVEIYTKSGEFSEFEKELLPTARRYIETAAETIDNTFGAPTDREKNLKQNLLSIGAQALVPTGLASRAIKDTAGKGAQVAFDLTLPGTTNYTKTGIGLNAGVGAGLTVGADVGLNEAKGVKELIGNNPKTTGAIVAGAGLIAANEAEAREKQKFQDVDDTTSEDHVKSSVANLAEGVAIGAMILGGAGIAAKAINLQQIRKNLQQNTGPIETGENTMKNKDMKGIVAAEQKINELAPVKEAYLQSGFDYNDTVYKINEHTRHYRANAQNSIDMISANGKVEGLKDATVSFQAMNSVRQKLYDAGKLEDIERAIVYTDSIDDRKLKVSRAQKDYLDVDSKIYKAGQEGDMTTVTLLNKERLEAYQKWQAAANDLPESRPSATGLSIKEMQDHIDTMKLDSDYLATNQILRKSMNDLQEYFVVNGIKDKATIAEELKTRPNYIPLIHDPLSIKGETARGFGRLTEKLKNKFLSSVEDPIEEAAFKAKEKTAIIGVSGKERNLDLENYQVNIRTNPFDSIMQEWETAIRVVERNKFKSSIIDDLNGKGKVVQHDIEGRSSFSKQQLRMLNNKGMIDLDDKVAIARNGKVELYSVTEPGLQDALNYAPALSVPILRTLNSLWKLGTTGKANASFGFTSSLYDTAVISQARPRDSVYGSDLLFKLLNPNDQAHKITGDVARTAGHLYADPIGHLINFGSAINYFFRDHQATISNKITNDLMSDTGFFSSIGKAIGKDNVQKVGNAITKNLEESMFHLMARENAIESVSYAAPFMAMKEVDKILDTMKIPKGLRTLADITTSPVQLALYEYRVAMSALTNMARFSYAQQNMLLAARKYGGYDKIPDNVINKITTETRTLAGNYAVKPGDKRLQMLDSAVPFVNVAFQSSRNIWERASRDPYVASMIVTGALVPTLYGYHWMSTASKDHNQLFWRDTPLWERQSTIYKPTPKAIMHYAKTGEWLLPDQDGLLKVPLMPDLRGPINMTITGMRAAGIMPYGTKDRFAPMDAHNEFAQALKQLLPLNLPPPIDAAAKASGYRIELGSMIPGSKDEFIKPLARDPHKTTMNAASNISIAMSESIAGIFGSAAKNWMEALNTYTIQSDKGDKLFSALGKGLNEIKDRKFSDPRYPIAPIWTAGSDRVYTNNPVSQRAIELRKPIETLAYNQDYKQALDDPFLNQVKMMMAATGKRHPILSANKKIYKQLREELDANEVARQLPLQERNKRKADINRKINELNNSNTKALLDAQEGIANNIGEEYKQIYGKEFTFQDAFDRINQARNKTRQRRLARQ